MTENNDYLHSGNDRNLRLSGEVLMLMLKGAGYAALPASSSSSVSGPCTGLAFFFPKKAAIPRTQLRFRIT